jgi:hypothetical protein
VVLVLVHLQLEMMWVLERGVKVLERGVMELVDFQLVVGLDLELVNLGLVD